MDEDANAESITESITESNEGNSMNNENNDVTLARRKFLVSGGGAALGLVSVTAMSAMSTTSLASDLFSRQLSQCLTRLSFSECYSLEKSVASDFTPHIGSDFVVSLPEGDIVLRLKKVYIQAAPQNKVKLPSHIRQEPFGLIFTGQNGVDLESATHEFRHQQLGAMSLFVSSVGLSEEGMSRNFNVVFG